MSMENPDDPVSNLKLTALIDAVVEQALSSCPDHRRDDELLCSPLIFGTRIRALMCVKGVRDYNY